MQEHVKTKMRANGKFARIPRLDTQPHLNRVFHLLSASTAPRRQPHSILPVGIDGQFSGTIAAQPEVFEPCGPDGSGVARYREELTLSQIQERSATIWIGTSCNHRLLLIFLEPL
jgi:hypothetical protein